MSIVYVIPIQNLEKKYSLELVCCKQWEVISNTNIRGPLKPVVKLWILSHSQGIGIVFV